MIATIKIDLTTFRRAILSLKIDSFVIKVMNDLISREAIYYTSE